MSKAGRFTCALLLLASVPDAAAAKEDGIARIAQELISSWRIREAAELLKPFQKASKRPAALNYALGRLAYFRGDYVRADELLGQAVAANPNKRWWKLTHLLVRSTRKALAGYQEVRRNDGKLIIRYSPGIDAVLVPEIISGIEAALRNIGGDLGFVPDEPLLVEVYPSASVLAQVSPLTEKDIETSGTIALCKYNRLMITSPRALLRGYPWLDSLAHEFVHYAVTKLSHNTVPIWLHEGIAKWEERRWRGVTTRRLQPSAEDLLARALKKKKLITFEQMHPSMAKLPSQDDAGLAFAEVFTVVDFLHQRTSLKGIRRVLELMRKGKSDADAIAAVTKMSFARFKKEWMRFMRKLKLKIHPGRMAMKMRFKKKGRRRSDLKDIRQKRARDLTHLGELLRHRGRLRAAVVEYRKALKLTKNNFPIIENKLAKSLLGLRRAEEVPEVLEPTLGLYPSYATTYTHLGRAYQMLGKVDKAVSSFQESKRLNPFNPKIYEGLVRLYRSKGDEAKVRQAERNLNLLRGSADNDPWAPSRSLPK